MIEVQRLNLAFGEGRSVTRCCTTLISTLSPARSTVWWGVRLRQNHGAEVLAGLFTHWQGS